MKLYLPLKCTSLPHYLKAGVIKPFCMYENILKDDIQALLGENHYILLLKAKNKMPQNADFLVELDINDDDKNLIVFNEYFLYKFLLPITKITAIFSKNQDLNDKYIDLIENSQTSIGGDAFICHSFFTTENFIDFELKIDNISEHKFDQKILNRIYIFDKILGAFAFARFKENNRHYANFFDELALINENFKKQYENIVKTNYTRVTFNKNIDEKDLLKAFKVLGGFYILESADVDLFFAALKANDVKKGDHAVQEAIREIRKFNGNTRKEFVVLFNYGYFKGYQNIRNRYFDKKVKFDLNDEIDILTLNSVFNVIFKIDVVSFKPIKNLNDLIDYKDKLCDGDETYNDWFLSDYNKKSSTEEKYGMISREINDKINKLRSEFEVSMRELDDEHRKSLGLAIKSIENLENALNTQKQENNKFQNLIDEKQKSIDELNSKISDLENNIEKKEKANLKLENKTIKSELESAKKIDKPKRTRKNISKSKAKNDSSDSLF